MITEVVVLLSALILAAFGGAYAVEQNCFMAILTFSMSVGMGLLCVALVKQWQKERSVEYGSKGVSGDGEL